MTFYGLILSIYLKIVLFLRIYFAVLQVLKVFFSLFFIQFLSQLKFISQYINLYIKYILYTYECLYVCKKKNGLSYGRKFKRSNKTDFIQEKRMR